MRLIRHGMGCPLAGSGTPVPDPAHCVCGQDVLERRVRAGFLWVAPPAGEVTLVFWRADRTLFNVIRVARTSPLASCGRVTTLEPGDALGQAEAMAMPDPWGHRRTVEFQREQPVTELRGIYDLVEGHQA